MEIQSIPLAAHENDMARNHKVIKWLIIGWAVSVIILSSVVYSLSFGWEETTETTTTEKTITQDSGDSGSNVYAGGDIVGEADYYGQDDYYNDDENQA